MLLDLIEILDGAGVSFRSATEPIDTSGPIGRLVLQVLGASGNRLDSLTPATYEYSPARKPEPQVEARHNDRWTETSWPMRRSASC